MPRGQKSKLRSREKRRQARDETQALKDVQPTAAEAEEAPSCSSSVPEDAVSSTSAAGLPQQSQGDPPAPTDAVGGARRKSGKGARSRRKETAHFSQSPTVTESSPNDILIKKAGMVMQYMLYKYKMKEPIIKREVLKIVSKRFREQFPEILKKASEHLELVFGLELKEVKSNGSFYNLVIKSDVTSNEGLPIGLGFPSNGVLVPLLGVIFLNGNRASEDEIWEFLSILGIYDGKIHTIFGDPRKLITQDLVQAKYLEYHQVPGSDPPFYEFLWGPRAYAETSKMRVLEFLAKVNDTVPTAFPLHYEEALREQEERARAKLSAKCGIPAKACVPTKAIPDSTSGPK